jgi:hypothetical protein
VLNIKIVILPLVLLSACGNTTARTYQSAAAVNEQCDYTLRLEADSLFVELERIEITKAITNWRSASKNRICFQIVWRDTSNDMRLFRSDDRFTIYSWRRSWQITITSTVKDSPCPKRDSCLGLTIWEHNGQTSDIFIITQKRYFLRATLEHELGHMFGLRHTQVYESIMFSDIRSNKTIGTVDRKNLDCLLKTHSFLQNENDCIHTK